MMWKLFLVLVASFSPTSSATGAFGTLWLLDQRRVGDFPGYELFTMEHESYGRNMFTMIASHASQYWFEIYAVYVEDPDAIGDPSDIYVKQYRGERTLVFIGYASFILIMARLLPMMAEGLIPWHELVVQSNDYENEMGCRVTVRSYLEPMMWWQRVGAELSIRAGALMFQNFKTIKLPRLHLGSEWNYASWRPYLAWGPHYFIYTPHKSLNFRETMKQMADEENYMAETAPIHAIAPKTMRRIVKAYAPVYTEGHWLTKGEKVNLSRKRKAMY